MKIINYGPRVQRLGKKTLMIMKRNTHDIEGGKTLAIKKNRIEIFLDCFYQKYCDITHTIIHSYRQLSFILVGLLTVGPVDPANRPIQSWNKQ